jgi:hypothetical protein
MSSHRSSSEPGRPPARLKVTTAGDVVTLVPYLLGFQPADSIVVVSLVGRPPRFGPCFRLDLPDSRRSVAEVTDYARDIVTDLGLPAVVLLAFSDHADVAEPALRRLRRLLRRVDVRVEEMVRADGRRWWSLSCQDPRCCPPAGTAYDADTSPLAVAAVVAGLQKAPDRDALRDRFRADDELRRRVVAELEAVDPAQRPAPEAALRRLDAVLASTGPAGVSELAALLDAVQDPTVRLAVCTSVTRETADRHLDLWSAAVRGAPDGHLPAAGLLAGLAAWQAGTGVLMSHAADRIREVSSTDPGAAFLESLVDNAVPPDAWARLQHHLPVVGRAAAW